MVGELRIQEFRTRGSRRALRQPPLRPALCAILSGDPPQGSHSVLSNSTLVNELKRWR